MKGKNNSQGSENASEAVNNVVKLLCTLSKWIDEIPPIQQPQRFGNQAFKTWYNKLKNVNILLNYIWKIVNSRQHFTSVERISEFYIELFSGAKR